MIAGPPLVLDPLLHSWLIEAIGRGDRATGSIYIGEAPPAQGAWTAKAPGVIAGLPVAQRVFHIWDEKVTFAAQLPEGELCHPGQVVATLSGPIDALLWSRCAQRCN